MHQEVGLEPVHSASTGARDMTKRNKTNYRPCSAFYYLLAHSSRSGVEVRSLHVSSKSSCNSAQASSSVTRRRPPRWRATTPTVTRSLTHDSSSSESFSRRRCQTVLASGREPSAHSGLAKAAVTTVEMDLSIRTPVVWIAELMNARSLGMLAVPEVTVGAISDWRLAANLNGD